MEISMTPEELILVGRCLIALLLFAVFVANLIARFGLWSDEGFLKELEAARAERRGREGVRPTTPTA